MKAPVLLAVVGEAAEFEPLFAAAGEREVRLGWLELDPVTGPPPSMQAPPFDGPFFRAVSVGERWSVALKPRKGPPVLRDLLREHFLGADVVLIKGVDLFPRLRRTGELWLLAESAERDRQLDLEALFARLRKPELRWRERAEGDEGG